MLISSAYFCIFIVKTQFSWTAYLIKLAFLSFLAIFAFFFNFPAISRLYAKTLHFQMALCVQNTVIREFFEFSNLDFRTFWTIWFMAEPVCTVQSVFIDKAPFSMNRIRIFSLCFKICFSCWKLIKQECIWNDRIYRV